jgi:hypothetical protein
MKDISMKSSDHSEVVPAPIQFAAGDVAEGHDLKWRIMACLRSCIPGIQSIHVTVFGNTAALRGEVRTLQEKRLGINCCRHVPGVMRVVDDLTVAEQTPVFLDPKEDLS